MADPKVSKKVRGVYEHPKGSEVWWIQYFDHGRRRRERVGTKGNAIKLYQKRRTQILLGDKLPELQRKRVTFGELLDDAVAFAREHNKTASQYAQKAEMLRATFGPRAAEDIQAEELAAWIRARHISGSSFNRYRSFLSLCFREGIRNRKVTLNTARLIAQKREPRGRKRFLSREEYERVLDILRKDYPSRAVDFILSVNTGMRLSEQYGLAWKNVDLVRREIYLADTKNGESRTIPMNSIVFDELTALGAQPRNAPVFPRPRAGTGSIKPRWFTAVIRRAEIEDYTWHNNRHTFCSWLAIGGTPLRTIQELAGHKTISMTARYSHLSPDHKGSEIEKLVHAGKPKVVSIRSATRTAKP